MKQRGLKGAPSSLWPQAKVTSSQQNWKEWGEDPALEALQGAQPCQHLGFSSGEQFLDLRSPERWENFCQFKPARLWWPDTEPQETSTGAVARIVSCPCGQCARRASPSLWRCLFGMHQGWQRRPSRKAGRFPRYRSFRGPLSSVADKIESGCVDILFSVLKTWLYIPSSVTGHIPKNFRDRLRLPFK